MTARRISPTGRLVLPADADRDTWLAARRKGIGSSDVPRILGMYPSPLRVWYDKRGELPDTDDEPKLWGRKLEAPVAEEWTRRNRSVVRRVGLVAHVDEPWRIATLDRRVAQCPLDPTTRDGCGLEVKVRNVYGASKWLRNVPDDVLAQTLHQARVTGYSHIHVAVLIGNSDYRQTVVHVDRERETYEFVAAEVDAFHERHMVLGERPAGSDDADLWDELYAARSGIVDLDLDAAVEALEAKADYVAAASDESAAKARKKSAKSRLVGLLGDGELAVAGGELVFSYLEQAGAPKVDLQQLAERWPDAYAACVTPSSHRTINVGARGRVKEPSRD